ncbi:MAG: hypothetical protein NC541_07990 [bacterium]|nr:hypothetical protein [bacterium]
MSVKMRIKSYLAFTSLGYRLVMYLAVPLSAAGIQLLFLIKMGGSGVPAVMTALILLEILADHWFLGGIQEKNAEKLDCLKTSSRGMQMMESVLILDVIRHFLEAAAIFGSCFLISLLLGGETLGVLGGLALPILETGCLSVAGTLIARFWSTLNMNMLIGYVAAIIGIVCFALAEVEVCPLWVSCGAAALLGAGVGALAVKTAMRKVKEGYHDK